ncbi:MauE/DoxX family redox-associated membrane protein [Flavobacterium sp.]|uniref:MauE/DoxX family redox-associated membrane protein n=1 Tax=Flavobacterium sp. TaxID=239 RepID=UPI004034C638
MKIPISLKNTLVDIICLLYILLFIYAAVSKLLDFENFRVQLGQSPLLSAFAGTISWFIPAIEIIIALALFHHHLRIYAMYGAFALMVMFTAYIFIILNFGSFVPCSCGGVLEKMGWTEHLIFNIVFIILALIGLLLEKDRVVSLTKSRKFGVLRPRVFYMILASCFFGGVMLVTALYLLSEKEMHRNNSFLRRYPPHPVTTLKGLSVKYNSYYIAGVAKGRIYLGNTSAPLHILSVDTTLNDLRTHQIKLDNKQQITFYSPQIRIHFPYFFMIDGSVPVIFKGGLSDWEAQHYWQGDSKNTFARVEAVSPTEFVYSGIDQGGNQNVIGRINIGKPDSVQISKDLLQKQVDGLFDSDGMLRYNSELNRLIYVYYYRNEFFTVDKNLRLDYRGRTIDTIKNPSIKIASTKSGQVKRLAEQPIVVNQHSYSSGKYLFIQSDRLGRHEPEEMLKDALIIDVYDVEKQTYEFSFYLYNYKGEKIRAFHIYNNILVGLSDNYIVLYRLQPINFDMRSEK